MATIKYFLDERRQKKDGSFPIKLYVKHNKAFLMATDYTAFKEDWNGMEYKKTSRNYQTKNAMLRATISKIERKLFELEDNDTLENPV